MTPLALPAGSGTKLIKTLAEYIRLPQYLKIKGRGILKGKHTYSRTGWYGSKDNMANDFWSDAVNGRIQPDDVVRLENVILTEWFPRAPGAHLGWQGGNTARQDDFRALQRAAESSDAVSFKIGPEGRTGYKSEPLRPTSFGKAGRRTKRVPPSPQDSLLTHHTLRDRTHIFEGSEEHLVLSPERKTLVVLSGFGNLRFSVKPEGRLLCAVQMGQSGPCPNAAEGIPVLVRPQLYDKIGGGIRGGLIADIEGVYAKLPEDIDKSVWRVKGVPRYCILIESQMLVAVRGPYSNPLACYAWTLFEYPGEHAAEYAFAYAPFDGSKPNTIGAATDFIEKYIRHYRGNSITDFDEEVPRFDAQIKLGDLMNDRIDFAKLDQKMSTVRAAVHEHESRMLLMAIRGGGTSFTFP